MKLHQLVAGVLLALIGVGLGIVGYQKTQPTAGQSLAAAVGELSGVPVPRGLRPDTGLGYTLLAVGAAAVLVGIWAVVAADGPHGRAPHDSERRS